MFVEIDVWKVTCLLLQRYVIWPLSTIPVHINWLIRVYRKMYYFTFSKETAPLSRLILTTLKLSWFDSKLNAPFSSSIAQITSCHHEYLDNTKSNLCSEMWLLHSPTDAGSDVSATDFTWWGSPLLRQTQECVGLWALLDWEYMYFLCIILTSY